MTPNEIIRKFLASQPASFREALLEAIAPFVGIEPEPEFDPEAFLRGEIKEAPVGGAIPDSMVDDVLVYLGDRFERAVIFVGLIDYLLEAPEFSRNDKAYLAQEIPALESAVRRHSLSEKFSERAYSQWMELRRSSLSFEELHKFQATRNAEISSIL